MWSPLTGFFGAPFAIFCLLFLIGIIVIWVSVVLGAMIWREGKNLCQKGEFSQATKNKEEYIKAIREETRMRDEREW